MERESSKRKEGSFPARYVLAVDLGSGGPKVAIVADNGDVVASSAERVDTRLLPGGGAEQDPEQWWQSAKKAAKQVIREANVSSEKIVAVSCDSQWSVAVPVDENGEPLMQAIHWLDTRGGPYNRKVIGGSPVFKAMGY